jgi:hypothetical protein
VTLRLIEFAPQSCGVGGTQPHPRRCHVGPDKATRPVNSFIEDGGRFVEAPGGGMHRGKQKRCVAFPYGIAPTAGEFETAFEQLRRAAAPKDPVAYDSSQKPNESNLDNSAACSKSSQWSLGELNWAFPMRADACIPESSVSSNT